MTSAGIRMREESVPTMPLSVPAIRPRKETMRKVVEIESMAEIQIGAAESIPSPRKICHIN